MVQQILNDFILHPQPHQYEDELVQAVSVLGKLGANLPDTEKELFELLKDFIFDNMQKNMYQMDQAYAQQDWNQIEYIAHKINK